ncbi:SDR family NAD(P)-dependent oxidoreductase [Microbacterium sp.]|uniref:SDR family NAD(P)-dependent oxidoreductase n=1 Tax=Microbacterium sp. TaxID=51671 RepID=UPI0039E47C98
MAERTRAAFVTGGASGIGASIVRQLADHGFAVAIADVDGAAGEALAAEVADSAFVELDVTDGVAVVAAVASVTESLGPIDVLVNSAGFDVLGPFVDSDEASWRRLIDVNLLGTIRTTQQVLPGMLARGRGRIINISSEAGRIGAAGQAVYGATKGGIIAFGKSVAQEVAADGVTVNTVCPGLTATPPVRALLDSGDPLVHDLVGMIPARRVGQPDDIAQAVGFLASDGAAYITGQTLSVSGGISMV